MAVDKPSPCGFRFGLQNGVTKWFQESVGGGWQHVLEVAAERAPCAHAFAVHGGQGLTDARAPRAALLRFLATPSAQCVVVQQPVGFRAAGARAAMLPAPLSAAVTYPDAVHD